ncbi:MULTISPECIES: helix-turn-helix domain-containing protein [unclassified Streptomyces]|uniref:helix-turn-helix domain-containing protein n=1 Tax=unclassified Streptomyces TaxID=2593676 RepID=UPI00344C11AF
MHGTQSVEKAARILRVTAEEGPLSVGEVARKAGLSKTTAYRIIVCLCGEGLMEKTSGGYMVVPLRGAGEAASQSLGEAALPYLLDFYSATGIPIGIAVKNADTIKSLRILHSPRQRETARGLTAPSAPGFEAARIVLESYGYFTERRTLPDMSGETALTVIRRRAAHVSDIRTTGIAVPVMITRRRAAAAVHALVLPEHHYPNEQIERMLHAASSNISHTLIQQSRSTSRERLG